MECAEILKHEIEIKYRCPNTGSKCLAVLENPKMTIIDSFENGTFICIGRVKDCASCGNDHNFRI
jgi:hypothetical protein